ncbi:hypothetical protein PTSG_06036 [Salpingoeca rosetta]|uniref:Rho-GAP domain-containing protein n=1 Tax=Salpingoeca rosetta (strain ATCC 50818 / BSB-021) TaxID=946362 RepID=F2UDH7_SALR5|nr:uncharacterized protein PTSG_06036 [Salpingoeca rosetta]EGD74672.1 hypothetical protein PTSG_06036 [Salpingoeca rosetta]|eukprot:XP_004992929.1 hypothetical protein PTSG_06036 [Salpingoeca rosetta]
MPLLLSRFFLGSRQHGAAPKAARAPRSAPTIRAIAMTTSTGRPVAMLRVSLRSEKKVPPPRPAPPQAASTAAKATPATTADQQQQHEEEEEDFSDIESLGVLSTAGVDRQSRPVFVFYACKLPPRADNLHDKMLRYMVKTMDAIVENDYSIIYFHHGLSRDVSGNLRGCGYRVGWTTVVVSTKPSLNWLRKVYFSFDRKYKKNLKALYVVHATMFVRTVMTILRPFISKKFGRKITFIHELSALESHVHIDQLHIPDVVKEHDEKQRRSKRTRTVSGAQTAGSTGPRVFGESLDCITAMDEDSGLPAVIAAAINHLRLHGMDVEGIFRRSANANTIKELKQQANEGAAIDFSAHADIHIPAVIVKTFLRDLPEPLLTHDKFAQVLAISGMEDSAEKLQQTKDIFHTLPPRNLALARCLFLFFKDIAERSEENKMTASNLAIVIGPNLLWSRDMAANLATMGQINVFTQYAIENARRIFPDDASADEATADAPSS